MSTYRRETHIDAPFEDVWAFHSTTDGLEALTPEFMHLTIETVTGPNGESPPEQLDTGSRIELSVRPFGIGPRQRMVSIIAERSRDDESAMFRDIMDTGPFAKWKHTHRFFLEEDGTRLVDEIEYQLPGGAVGRLASPLGRVGLAPMFWGRHRTTKQLLEE